MEKTGRPPQERGQRPVKTIRSYPDEYERLKRLQRIMRFIDLSIVDEYLDKMEEDLKLD